MKKHNAGISLIEILVALSVSIVLLGGIIQVVVSNGAATKTINGFSSLQENARVALEDLTESLRSAGHFGGSKGEDVDILGTLSLTGIGDCNSAWILDSNSHIRGYDGASSAASISGLPSNCIPNDEYVEDSDVLVLRYASAKGASPTPDLDTNTIYYRSVAGTAGARGAEILKGSDIGSSSFGTSSDGVGTYNYQYKTELYFVRPCSDFNAGNCEDGIPTLVRYTLDGGSLVAEAIAEGVEQLQVEYGIDASGNDYVADSYLKAADVTDWDAVVSTRYSIVVRSHKADANASDTETYELAGNYDYTPDSAVSKHVRKAFTRVVQLRNMSRGQ